MQPGCRSHELGSLPIDG